MKKVLVCTCLAAWVAIVAGCSSPPTPPANTDKEFEKLYKEYSARFYENMTTKPEEGLTPAQITADASRIWEEILGTQKDLLKRRAEESLKKLDTATPVQEDLYLEVRSGTRKEPPAGQSQLPAEKQFFWNPITTAQIALDNWLGYLLEQRSYALRSVMLVNAQPTWEALDRNIDHPKLLLRQGPMLFLLDLSRKDDYYQADKIRWLRPKSMGPLPGMPEAPAAGTPPAGVPAPGTPAPAPGTGASTPPAPAKPAAKAPEKPADKAGPARPKG